MDIDALVRDYACVVVANCSPERITAVDRFESGERPAVFKVSYLDPARNMTDLVVRVSLSNDAAERSQAEREAAVLAKVQGVAGPELHDFRSESEWFDAPAMCMQYIPGQQRNFAAVGPTDLERLGAVVGWLHELPTDDLVEWFPDIRTARAYQDARVAQVAAYMPSVRDPLPPSTQRRVEHSLLLVDESLESARRGERFRADEKLVLLHVTSLQATSSGTRVRS